MEASAIQAGPGLARPRILLGSPLLRLRSDQQLVALFRDGNEEAFRVIHDRYRLHLQAYMRQMLPGHRGDIEDALQDVFLRAYAGLRTSNRALTLKPWLYRVAHNRAIDQLRRPGPLPELLEAHHALSNRDPVVETERRESLRRLIADIGRLPEQQRSALLMRELSGMGYADVAEALGISVPAVKSLLVRARIGLTQAAEARDAACTDIRRELAEAHERGVRPSWMARRHLRDCVGCRACRTELRTTSRQVAALSPTLGPFALLAKLFGVGTGGGGTATAAGAGGAMAGGALSGGTATGLGLTIGHVATVLAAAVVTAGSAVAVQQTVTAHSMRSAKHAVHTVPSKSTHAPSPLPMRLPSLVPAAPPAVAHPHPRRALITEPASASVADSPSAEHGGGGAPTSPSEAGTGTQTPPASATSTSTTCAASVTTCATSPTSCTTPPSGSSTTTGTASTDAQGTQTTTTPASTSGSGAGTTSTSAPTGTAAGTADSTCATTAQSTGTQGTQATGTSQPVTVQGATGQASKST